MATGQDRVFERLIALAQLDVDAILAYEQAIKNIDPDEGPIVDALVRFQRDHERHVVDLRDVALALGGEFPELKRDVKGAVIEGMTAALSKVGTRSALVAMTQNEMLTNSAYKSACETTMPEIARQLVEAHYEDEKRHIAAISHALREKFGRSDAETSEAPTLSGFSGREQSV